MTNIAHKILKIKIKIQQKILDPYFEANPEKKMMLTFNGIWKWVVSTERMWPDDQKEYKYFVIKGL